MTPTTRDCADAHLRPEIHPQPEVSAGYVAERSGNVVTVKLAVANSGTFDAYGIDAVMYSPDGTTTIGNNTVGGNGRVRPGNHVAVGSLIKPPDLANWGASTAKPYAGGQFSGAADRTFTFTASTPGVVGQGATAMTLERRRGRRAARSTWAAAITRRCRWMWPRGCKSASTPARSPRAPASPCRR